MTETVKPETGYYITKEELAAFEADRKRLAELEQQHAKMETENNRLKQGYTKLRDLISELPETGTGVLFHRIWSTIDEALHGEGPEEKGPVYCDSENCINDAADGEGYFDCDEITWLDEHGYKEFEPDPDLPRCPRFEPREV